MLPLSHDEVVHGKGSIMHRMPGDEWQRFANLRLLYGYMFTHPGTQLLFMGDEFAQTSEWNIEKGLEWWLTEFKYHKGMQEWIKTLNAYYRTTPSLHEKQFSPEGFQWIDHNDNANSTISYLRYDKEKQRPVAVICNFTPVPRPAYRIGLPNSGVWKEVVNSDSIPYGGTGEHLNKGAVKAEQQTYHGRPYSAEIALPPLGMVVLEHEGPIRVKKETKKVATKAPKTSKKGSKGDLLGSIGKAKAKDKDDLQKINGIGPKLEDMLYDLGIYTYKQLSAMTDKEYDLVDDMLGKFKGRGKRDDWAGQAKELL
jgi:1,4-alpha-glucan branching enzyme